MKKLVISSILMVMMLVLGLSISPKSFAAPENVEVTLSAVFGGDPSNDIEIPLPVAAGTTIDISDLGAISGHQFAFWIVNGNVKYTLGGGYTIPSN